MSTDTVLLLLTLSFLVFGGGGFALGHVVGYRRAVDDEQDGR